MESSDFCLVISQPFFLSSRCNTLSDTVFARNFAYPNVAPGLICASLALKRLIIKERTDLPSSQGFLASIPGSSTPVGRDPRSFQKRGVAFRLVKNVGTHKEGNFGAQSPWPTGSLSTLNPQRHHWRSKTRFRVVTSLARVRLSPTGNQCTVSVK